MVFCIKEPYLRRASVIAVSTACAVFSAQAQAQAPSQQKEQEPQTVQQVEISGKTNITKGTAKTNAPLRDIPMTISVVPAEVLQDQGALTLDAAIKNVSGLSQSSTNNYGYFNNYLARGLPVNFLRDGLPDGPAINGYARSLTDVQQIEVLKGPGSALFGSGAPGGFVNLVSKKPEAKAANTIAFGAGSFNARNLSFDFTGPLDQDTNYRFIGAYGKTDGYRGFGSKNLEILPSFSFQINPSHRISLDIRHLDSTIYNDSVGLPFQSGVLVAMPQETRFYTPFSVGKSKIDRLSIGQDLRLNEQWQLRASLSYGKRELEFRRNVPNWRLSNTAAGITMANRNWRDQQDQLSDASAQVDAVWQGDFAGTKHELTMGVAWDKTQGTVQRKQALLAPISNLLKPVLPEQSNASIDEVLMWKRDIQVAQTGLYVQDQVSLSEQIKVRAGLRFSRYLIDDNGDYNRLFDAGGAFRSSLAANGQSFQSKPAIMQRELASDTSNEIDPSLGLVYQPSATSAFYIGASTGSFSNFNSEMGRTAFVPETSKQIELGNKASFMNGKLTSNVAFYKTQRHDFFRTANGISGMQGSSKAQGLDVEITMRPFHAVLVRFAYAYQDAKFSKYVDVLTGVNDRNVVGKTVNGVSQNQANIWASYDFQSPELKGFGLGAGINYLGNFYADPANHNRSSNAPVLEMAAFYRQANYELQANIGNLTNAKWARYAPGENAIIPGDARSLNVSARMRF